MKLLYCMMPRQYSLKIRPWLQSLHVHFCDENFQSTRPCRHSSDILKKYPRRAAAAARRGRASSGTGLGRRCRVALPVPGQADGELGGISVVLAEAVDSCWSRFVSLWFGSTSCKELTDSMLDTSLFGFRIKIDAVLHSRLCCLSRVSVFDLDVFPSLPAFWLRS